MAELKQQYRLPTGHVTENEEYYLRCWETQVICPLKDKYNLWTRGFGNGGISVSNGNNMRETAEIPMWLVEMMLHG